MNDCMRQQNRELKEIGRAYLNAASYCIYQAKMNEINKKAIEAHNKKLETNLSVAELEQEIARLKTVRDSIK